MTKLHDSIRKITLRLLQEDVIVASWGITNVELFESHICFHVNGLKYTGVVEIKAKDCEEYEILLDGTSIGPGHLNSVVEIIDNVVEKTDYYQKHLEEWIIDQLKG